MKRIVALCAATALCLSLLSACGGKNSEAIPDSSEPAGAGQQEEKHVDLAAFAQTLQENHEFPSLERADPKDPDVGAVMLDNFYPGLTELDLEQLEAYLSVISFSGGEFVLAQAKSADDAAKVKDILQSRVEAKTTEGPGNYPEEVELWQRGAKVAGRGNYVLLVCHEDCDAIVGEFNALFES